jgi:putative modified peptide
VEQYSGREHVSKLGERLGDADFRDSFTSDPSQALNEAGIDEQALPDGVVDALRNCQPEELAAVAKVRNALAEAGVARDDAGEIV